MAERTMEKGPGAELEAVDTRKSSVLTVLEEYHRQYERHGVMSSTLQSRLSNLFLGQKLQIEGRLDRYNSSHQDENQIYFNGIVEVTAVMVDSRSGGGANGQSRPLLDPDTRGS